MSTSGNEENGQVLAGIEQTAGGRRHGSASVRVKRIGGMAKRRSMEELERGERGERGGRRGDERKRGRRKRMEMGVI